MFGTSETEETIMKLKKLFGKIIGAGLCMGMLLGCMPGSALQVKAATEPNYLTFTAEEAGSTLSLSWASASDVQTSTDHGTTWSAYARGTTITLANVGDSVSFKARGFVANNYANVNHVKMTGKIAASGSVTSLIDENGGDPNVTLPNDCFAHMFENCTSLTQAPELPATTLSDICYVYMFKNCTSLTQVPKLPATTLDVACYHSMFEGCTGLSLTTTKDADHTLAWSVPDTTEDLNWNLDMFAGCPNVDLGNGSKEPQMNTVYYQPCKHSYGSDGKCIYCGIEKAVEIVTPAPEATPTAGNTNGETQAAPNTNNPVAQNTTANVKAPATGEASPMASVMLALLIAGGFVVILVGVSKMRKHCK